MSQTIELPDGLADTLADEAKRAGLSLPDYAVRLLNSPRAPVAVTTGAELVAYWRAGGLIGDGTDIPDSPALARQLRDRVWSVAARGSEPGRASASSPG